VHLTEVTVSHRHVHVWVHDSGYSTTVCLETRDELWLLWSSQTTGLPSVTFTLLSGHGRAHGQVSVCVCACMQTITCEHKMIFVLDVRHAGSFRPCVMFRGHCHG